MKYSDPSKAFATAIARGALNELEGDALCAFDFMYMGDNEQGAHLFKNRNTRQYIAPVSPVRS